MLQTSYNLESGECRSRTGLFVFLFFNLGVIVFASMLMWGQGVGCAASVGP